MRLFLLRYLMGILAAIFSSVAACQTAHANQAVYADPNVWSLKPGGVPILVYSPRNAEVPDISIDCPKSSGEIHLLEFIQWNHLVGYIHKPASSLINEQLRQPISSGPIVRYYTFRRVFDAAHNVTTNDMDMRLQAGDPLWREFYRSGRLSIAESPIDAKTAGELSAVRQFTDYCRQRYPASEYGYDGMAVTDPRSDGDFAYPFTLMVRLLLLAGGLAVFGLAAVKGRPGIGLSLGFGLAISMVFACVTSGPFSSTLRDAWVVQFNETFVPIASVFGELSAVWLLLSLAAAGLGLAARGLWFARVKG